MTADRAPEHVLAETERTAREAWDAVPAFYRTPQTQPCRCETHTALAFHEGDQ